MPDSFRDTLLLHIASLKKQLSAAEASLHAYDQVANPPDVQPTDPAAVRFQGMRPIDAIREALAEHGGRMTREALMQALIDGGATAGKKRGIHNLRISIDVNEKQGKLVVDGDVVSISPDWAGGQNGGNGHPDDDFMPPNHSDDSEDSQ